MGDFGRSCAEDFFVQHARKVSGLLKGVWLALSGLATPRVERIPGAWVDLAWTQSYILHGSTVSGHYQIASRYHFDD